MAALAVPALLETGLARRTWPVPVAALPAAALVAVTFSSAQGGAAFAADAVHALAAAALLGSSAALAGSSIDGPGAGRPGTAGGPDVGGAGGGAAVDGPTVAPAGDGPLGEPSTPPVSGPGAAPGRPALPATSGSRGLRLPGTGLPVLGMVAGAIAVVAGAVRIRTAGPYSATDLVGTAYGRTALVALVLPALAAAVLGTDPRTRRRRAAPVADGAARRDGVRDPVVAGVTGVVAAVGVAAASVAGLLPAPAPAAVPGQALLRTVALGGDAVPVLVAPLRPGPNLVQLGGSGYPAPGAPAPAGGAGAMPGHDMSGTSGHDMSSHGGATVAADGDPVPFVSRPGARGGWAVLDVPAGTTSLTVAMAGDTATVPVDVGDEPGDAPSAALSGRDGPECASAIAGAVLAGGPGAGAVTTCPSRSLDPEQARALTATVRTMAEKGARTVRLVGDASPRSVAAARLVRDEGARAGLAFPPDAGNDPAGALVVVSGWEQAVDVLGEAGARARTTPTHLGGTFLAPWLLTGDVLRQTASAFLPLSFAPNEPDARRYALALAATHPDTAPSASGYLAWARAAGVPADPRPSLYGAAAVNVPMSVEPQGSRGHHGGPDPAAWYPGGTVVPVSGPMDPGGSR